MVGKNHTLLRGIVLYCQLVAMVLQGNQKKIKSNQIT
jgi:hypothetical protein